MDARDPEPDDLTRDIYKASDGRNPAGTLALVAAQLRLMAEQAGVAGPDATGYRPETAADHVPSGRAIVADTRHLHAVAQDSSKNPDRAQARDAAIATGDYEAVRRLHDEAVSALRDVLQGAAQGGIRITLEMSRAVVFARIDE